MSCTSVSESTSNEYIHKNTLSTYCALKSRKSLIARLMTEGADVRQYSFQSSLLCYTFISQSQVSNVAFFETEYWHLRAGN